jgi:uncharacterized membrane protein
MITNEAVVLGLLMASLGLIFYTASQKTGFFPKFYRFVPALLLAYFIPAILGSIGLFSEEITGEGSKLYFIASRYLLPASLILLTLSINFKAILGLGPKALIMFFTATVGIVVGGPLALWIVGYFDPGVLAEAGNNSVWRGLTTVAGSWIGGGANQAAMKEIYGAGETLFSAMIIVDVFVANLWMAFLLYGAGISDKIDKRLKADNSAIARLKESVASYRASLVKPLNFPDLMVLMAIVFAAVGLSHFLADNIAPSLGSHISSALEANPDSGWKFLSSLGSGFFWLVVFATLFGLLLSMTKARTYEGIGASSIGSLFIYVLVATIGMKMNLGELYANWGDYKSLIIIGLIWMLVHVLILLIVAKIIKAPFFYVAVGSQANVGGAASAPIVASAFSPSLAPVGVLLAVLGYALGTFAAILCAMMLEGVAF